MSSKIQTPTTLRGWNVYIDGSSYAGRISEGTPPKVTKKMEEYRNAGMFQPLKAWLGMEAQEVELTFSDVSVDIAKQIGHLVNDEINLTFRSAYKAESSDVYMESEMQVRGELVEFDHGNLKEGELTEVKVKIDVIFYKWKYDGVDIHEFDPQNAKYVINGKDLTQGMRDIILA